VASFIGTELERQRRVTERSRDRDVFILGAGFSKAVSGTMPLLGELPALLKEWDPSFAASWEPRLKALGYDVELLMTYLSQSHPWLDEATNLANRSQFLRFSEQLAEIIRERQEAALRGPCPDWLRSLVKEWDKRRANVATFNYDTLVEKCYEALDDAEPDHRNRLQLHPVFVTPMEARTGFAWDAERRSTFSLVKLHGSVSWYYSGAESFYGEAIYDLRPSQGWSSDGDPPWLLDKVPLIIPPTTDKSTFFQNETVRAQWRWAHFMARMAANVYCLGYSLPMTDLLARFMLSDLSRGHRVFIVNQADGSERAALLKNYETAAPAAQMETEFLRGGRVIPEFVEAYTSGALRE
jgi:hypothetical protein